MRLNFRSYAVPLMALAILCSCARPTPRLSGHVELITVNHQELARAKELNIKVVGLLQQGRYSQALPLAQQALAIEEKSLGPEHPETATSLNNLAGVYFSISAYGKAELLYKRALAIREKVLGPEHPDTAQSMDNLAELYKSLGAYAKAEPLYKRALAIFEKTLGSEHPETATCMNNLAGLYNTLGTYDKAESFYKRALAIYEKVLGPEHPDTATSLNNLAELFKILGAYAKAESLYKRALAIYEKVLGPEHPNTALGMNNLAELYNLIGAYGKAEPLYKRALAINEKVLGPEHPHTVGCMNNLAGLYYSLGAFGKAEHLFNQALAIYVKILGPEHPYTVTILNNLAALYYSVGAYGKAEPLYKRALAIIEKTLGPEHLKTALSLNNLAELYSSLGAYGKAEPLYKRALAIREKVLGREHPDTATSLNNLAFLNISQGRIDQAMAHFRTTGSHAGLGCCYLARREYKAAQKEFTRELPLVRDRAGAEEAMIADLIGLGLADEGMADMAGAVSAFQEAVDRIEAQYQTLSPAARRTFLGGNTMLNFKRLDAYEGLIRTLIKQKKNGYAAKALQVAERVKSRTLLEQLAARGAAGTDREDAVTLKKDRQFQQKLIMLYKQIEILDKLAREGKTVDRGRRKAVDAKLQEVQQQYEQFINEVKMNNRELASLISVQTVDVDEIQQLLDPDTTIVEYFTGAKNSYIWTITRNDIQVKVLDLDNKHIAGLVNDYRLALHPPGRSRSTGKKPVLVIAEDFLNRGVGGVVHMDTQKNKVTLSDELYRAIIQPVEDRLRTGKLIIVPHGSLHKLPFASLAHGGHFLMEHYIISTAPSASVLSYVTKKRNPNHYKLLAFANPKTMYPPLPATETEVAHIRTLFTGNTEVYKGPDATETRARLKSNTPDVVHFASHGEFNERQPMQSGLLLSRDRKNDGRLQVHELFGLNLKNANLVTLSACQTALAKIESGDDMIGLSRGFIYAGTPALLASLWDVEDNATATLMEAFYRNWLGKKMTRPEALRQAQLTVKNNPRTSDPYYWAAFELIGDWQ